MASRLNTFKDSMFIQDQDYISMLHEDCIRAIFRNLNHDEVDIISAVSQRMHHISEICRPLVRKSKAFKLTVFRKTYGQQCIQFVRRRPHASRCYTLDSRGEMSTMEYYGRQLFKTPKCHWTIRKSKLSSIIDQAAFLLSRYDIEVVYFHSMKIDHHTISLLERSWRGSNMDVLFDWECYLDATYPELGKRMLSLLLIAKPRDLRLNIIGMDKEIDVNFLRNYARAVSFPYLYVNCDDMSQGFTTDASFADILSAYGTMIAELQVDADWIIPAIIKRLRCKRRGELNCNITRRINRDDIIKFDESDLGCGRSGDVFELRLLDTPYAAIIEVDSLENSGFRLNVAFLEFI